MIVEFDTMMMQFDVQGEKTGWTYIEISPTIAQQMKPGNKKSFRVKGMLDGVAVAGLALMPMGEGNFIMAIKAEIRKALHKNAGAIIHVKIEPHHDFKIDIPADLQECFDFEPEAFKFYNSLPKSHREYFLKWINEAKTAETKAKRVVNTVNAMLRKWHFNVMVKEMRKKG